MPHNPEKKIPWRLDFENLPFSPIHSNDDLHFFFQSPCPVIIFIALNLHKIAYVELQ